MRYVVPTRTFVEIYSNESIERWLDRGNFKSLSSLLVSQLLGSDQLFDSKVAPDFVVAINPFDKLQISEAERVLRVVSRMRHGALLAIPTQEYHDAGFQGQLLTIDKWKSTLHQLGDVVHVYDSAAWSSFLVVKRPK
jgi:hypothetical protein